MRLSDRALAFVHDEYGIAIPTVQSYCSAVYQIDLSDTPTKTLQLLASFCEAHIERLAAAPQPQTWTDPRTNYTYRVVGGALQVRDEGAWCPAAFMPVAGREAISALFEPAPDPFDTLRYWCGSKVVSSSDFDEGAVDREALLAAYDAACARH